MSIKTKIKARTKRRKLRARAQIKGKQQYRISVFRSLNNIYAQLINDQAGKTVVSYSTLQMTDKSGDKKSHAKRVGQELAKLALRQGIEEVVFDRGSYLYHGRIKSLVEGLREGGLRI